MAIRIGPDLFRCPRCKEDKPRSMYYANGSRREGIQAYCKPCWNTHPALLRSNRARLDRNRANPVALEKQRVRAARHRDRDREAYNASKRSQYRRNLDRSRERTRTNAAAYRERVGSEILNEKARDYSRTHPEKNRRAARVRRARLAAVEVAAYVELEIFSRDGWVCALCGQPIDPSLPRNNPKGVTIDHVVPIARGGSDTPDNVQAAHFGCNSRKRDRVA